jgi:ABC-2 type transport system permease protein
MRVTGWIAWRVILEILRDRRTVAFFLLVPVVVMSLVYLALFQDETARIAIVARGAARLFVYDLERSLEQQKDVVVVPLDIPDDERDPKRLETYIDDALRSGQADGVLFFEESLLADRFAGKRGTLHLYLEGSRPTLTGLVASAVGDSADDLAAALPVVIDSDCSAKCANSVNVKPLEISKHYLYGSEDYRLVDFFLPVLLPFFVFFLTFILANITFQRERVRGTLERLLIAPVTLPQVVMGYVGGFLVFSIPQAAVVLVYLLALIGFPITGLQVLDLCVIAMLMLLIALLMGLTVSFAARNEFQAVQFIPLVILPQVFLSDLIWSIDRFPAPFRWFAMLLPLTHANIATRNVVLKHEPLWQSWPNLLAILAMFVAALAVLTFVGRRRTGSLG